MAEGWKAISVNQELHTLIDSKRIEMIGKRKVDISMAKITEEIIRKGINLVK